MQMMATILWRHVQVFPECRSSLTPPTQITAEVVDLPTGKRACLQQLLAKEQGEGYNLAEALRQRLETCGVGTV